MQYLVTVKKKSPVYSLWRKQNLYKARLQEVLFTYNKQSGLYSAQGSFDNIGALMKNPSLIVTVATMPVGDVAIGATITNVPGAGLEPSLSISETFEKVPKTKKKHSFFNKAAEE